ncbi:Trk system potassium transporter TrkA [Modicisalibacter zincidurans]|uniref:Trk system potassium uptake protein TrkA n=1 Tax=Modicisalibacter zincidurans TaxID=1178777 RepID=A0ABP9RCQ4_9GAMM|nr:Trk system potassium transporter TrkA [Halomonas zincidurans]
MKIVILGADQIGSSLAEYLAREGNEITVVDISASRLSDLTARLDIRTVEGKVSHPSVLRKAGCDEADLLIAVTDSDELNMLACEVANTLFNASTKIARVRDNDYLAHDELFSERALGIELTICPEQLVTDSIYRIFEFPGTLQVLDFAKGKVQLVAVKAIYGGSLVGKELSTLREHLPSVNTRVAAIYRRGKGITPQSDTVIETDDEVFFIASRKDIRAVMKELRRAEQGYRRVIIAGGGNIGERLAKKLQGDHHVKLIEIDAARAQTLAERLTETVVLNGSATRKNLLVEENIDDCDIYCALTNDDEDNIMSSLLAKRLGAQKVLTLINDPAYVELIQGDRIDIAISPQQVTISSILRHVRRGDVAKVHSLRRGAAEAIEAVAHGDADSSQVVGRRIEDIPLPAETMIGAIARGDEVILDHSDVVIETDDHLILFLLDKRRIQEIERLLQVKASYF